MMRTIKYGLTTALRGFEEPEQWTGTETIVTNATLITDVVVDGKRSASYEISPYATGIINIQRTVQGNCDTTIHLRVSSHANVTIQETILGKGTLRSRTLVRIDKESAVTYTILQNMDTSSIALLHYEATIEHSKLLWQFCGLGADTTQAFVGTAAGERSEVTNNAIIYGTGQQQFDIHVATNHVGAHSTSNMLTRSVLDDKARAVYHGLIHIGQESPECDSYQKDEVILLSDRAGADAIPNLEIQNNKVRCSHGASIGKLDEEKLFYFKSRGIEPMLAKRMITEGFLFSITPSEIHPLITEKAGGTYEHS